jgi:hypothetical protein
VTPGTAVSVSALPAPVQNTLQSFSQSGSLGSVSQIQGVNGMVFRASVLQNGQPVDLEIAPTGQILSRTPGVVGTGPITAANAAATALNNAQAGLPVSSLPVPVQNGIQSQLGANPQLQTVSRDDLANGSIFRVTAIQNGVPTELRFGANGTLLSSTPLGGSATSVFLPTAGALLPGTAVVMDQLPADIQNAIRTQLGTARPTQITQMQGTNGLVYTVQYDVSGRPMLMTLGPDGGVVNNVPISTVGAAATRATGTGSSTNGLARGTNNATRTSMRLEELPGSVQDALRENARYAEVRSITRERRVGGDVYVIAVRGDNNIGELTFDANGRILSDNRRDFTELSVPKIDFDDERVTGIPFGKVPVAIQDAVKAYATASDIRSITLGTDKDGRAVYDVIFYRDGRRDRMIIAKDGTLRRIEQNVSPILEAPDRNRQPVLALGDLPAQARETIRRQTDNVLIKEITTKKVAGEDVYQVRYDTNGAPVELLVATDGRVVLPEGSPEQEDQSKPLPAPLTDEGLASAKVVNATPEPATSTGAAAARERGTLESGTNLASDQAPAKVSLADVPAPVQQTAKRLAGDAQIEAITPKLADSGITYEVAYSQNGTRKTIMVNKDGAIVSEKK